MRHVRSAFAAAAAVLVAVAIALVGLIMERAMGVVVVSLITSAAIAWAYRDTQRTSDMPRRDFVAFIVHLGTALLYTAFALNLDDSDGRASLYLDLSVAVALAVLNVYLVHDLRPRFAAPGSNDCKNSR